MGKLAAGWCTLYYFGQYETTNGTENKCGWMNDMDQLDAC
jgi:hypothetical protein